MKDYDYRKPLISIHVPKAGGTSFITILQRWFGSKFYPSYYSEVKGRMPKKVRLKKKFSKEYRHNVCVHGHFNCDRGFGIDDYYPNATQLISILRNPLELQLSFFFFKSRLLANNALFEDGRRVNTFSNDVDEFLETTQSHMLLHFPREINLSNYANVIGKKFIHLGIMEEYQKSINLLADKLSKEKIDISHLNKSRRHQQPSQDSIKKFISKHELEYRVYEYAISLNN